MSFGYPPGGGGGYGVPPNSGYGMPAMYTGGAIGYVDSFGYGPGGGAARVGANGLLLPPEEVADKPHSATQFLTLNASEEMAYNDLWMQASHGEDVASAKAAGGVLARAESVTRGQLRMIWDLADHTHRGALNRECFFVALRLVALAQRGAEPSLQGLRNFTGIQLIPKIGAAAQATAAAPGFGAARGPAQQVEGGGGGVPPPVSLRENPSLWTISKEQNDKYQKLFHDTDKAGSGFTSGPQAVELFGKSGLPRQLLRQIWALSDVTQDGRLDFQEFKNAIHLVKLIRERKIRPDALPNKLDPAGPNWVRVQGEQAASAATTGAATNLPSTVKELSLPGASIAPHPQPQQQQPNLQTPHPQPPPPPTVPPPDMAPPPSMAAPMTAPGAPPPPPSPPAPPQSMAPVTSEPMPPPGPIPAAASAAPPLATQAPQAPQAPPPPPLGQQQTGAEPFGQAATPTRPKRSPRPAAAPSNPMDNMHPPGQQPPNMAAAPVVTHAPQPGGFPGGIPGGIPGGFQGGFPGGIPGGFQAQPPPMAAPFGGNNINLAGAAPTRPPPPPPAAAADSSDDDGDDFWGSGAPAPAPAGQGGFGFNPATDASGFGAFGGDGGFGSLGGATVGASTAAAPSQGIHNTNNPAVPTKMPSSEFDDWDF